MANVCQPQVKQILFFITSGFILVYWIINNDMFINCIILLQHVIDKILNLTDFPELMVTAVNKMHCKIFSDS